MQTLCLSFNVSRCIVHCSLHYYVNIKLMFNDMFCLQYEKTIANVVLRWHLQLDGALVCKSVTPSRIQENFKVCKILKKNIHRTYMQLYI